MKRKRLLERNSFVKKNVTILQEGKYGHCFFLKRLKNIFVLSNEFLEKQNLKRFLFSILLESFSRILKDYLQLGLKRSVNNIYDIFSRGNGIEIGKYAFLFFFFPKAYL